MEAEDEGRAGRGEAERDGFAGRGGDVIGCFGQEERLEEKALCEEGCQWRAGDGRRIELVPVVGVKDYGDDRKTG